MLDVVAKSDGEPLAARPVIDRPFGDRHVIVAAMYRQFHERNLVACDGPSPQPFRRKRGEGVAAKPWRVRGNTKLPALEHRAPFFHEGGAALGVVLAGEAFFDDALAKRHVALA